MLSPTPLNFILTEVYSSAHKAAKSKGKPAQECQRLANEARLEWLVKIIRTPNLYIHDAWFVLKLYPTTSYQPRWAEKSGPQDHPAVIRLLKAADLIA